MNNYTGNKGGQTIKPILANLIPSSRRYFSLFLGGGGLENSKEFVECNWIVSEKNPDLQLKAATSAAVVFSDYKDLIENFNFTSEDFIFCDPPYLLEKRKSGRSYYKHEFSFPEHVVFLNCIRSLKANILITHPECDLYDSMLKGWFKIPFSYMTRKGWFNDCVYLNYLHCSVELVTYKYLGNDRTTRQQIKRKRKNFISKFEKLHFHEQRAIVNDMRKKGLL